MSADGNAADILQSYFERSASVVHNAFLQIESTYLGPLIGYVSRSFRTRPIPSTFLAIFFALSFLPTISFIGFSLCTFGFLTFLALIGSFIASVLVIGLTGFFLACTVALLFFLAFFLTGSALAIFLAHRLLALVRSDGARVGVSKWTKETKTRLYPGPNAVRTTKSDVPAIKGDDDDDDSDSNVSVGSTVVVNSAADSGASGNQSPLTTKQELL